MKRALLVVAGLAAAALGTPGRAAAQIRGMPVWNSPKGGTGLTIAADFGWPDSAGGNGTTYAGRAVFGMSILTLSGTVGSRSPEGGGSVTEYGGTAALRLIGGSLMPVAVNLQGGFASFSQSSVTTTRGTLALGFAIDIPTPGVTVEPWFAPGMRLTHSGSTNDTQFGMAGGLTIGFGLLGIHAAMDYENLASGGHTTTLGFGAHLAFRPAFGL
jgi:hypothetical protein